MSLVAYDSSDSDDSVQDIATPVLSIPKKGSKRQSGPVKICLPTLVSKIHLAEHIKSVLVGKKQ